MSLNVTGIHPGPWPDGPDRGGAQGFQLSRLLGDNSEDRRVQNDAYDRAMRRAWGAKAFRKMHRSLFLGGRRLMTATGLL